MIVHDVEQNTPEWHQLRLGIPTASKIKDLFTAKHGIPKGLNKTILNYAAELAADKQSGKPLSVDENVSGLYATERGHNLEPIARRAYDLGQDEEVKQIGFVTNHGCGCSPDSLVGERGLLEIKCLLHKAHTLCVADCMSGTIPADYYIQCQAQLWMCDRDWCDLYFYHPELPKASIRINADAKFQALMVQQVQLLIETRDSLIDALEAAA